MVSVLAEGLKRLTKVGNFYVTTTTLATSTTSMPRSMLSAAVLAIATHSFQKLVT